MIASIFFIWLRPPRTQTPSCLLAGRLKPRKQSPCHTSPQDRVVNSGMEMIASWADCPNQGQKTAQKEIIYE
jgi:hypothetical protein